MVAAKGLYHLPAHNAFYGISLNFLQQKPHHKSENPIHFLQILYLFFALPMLSFAFWHYCNMLLPLGKHLQTENGFENRRFQHMPKAHKFLDLLSFLLLDRELLLQFLLRNMPSYPMPNLHYRQTSYHLLPIQFSEWNCVSDALDVFLPTVLPILSFVHRLLQ